MQRDTSQNYITFTERKIPVGIPIRIGFGFLTGNIGKPNFPKISENFSKYRKRRFKLANSLFQAMIFCKIKGLPFESIFLKVA